MSKLCCPSDQMLVDIIRMVKTQKRSLWRYSYHGDSSEGSVSVVILGVGSDREEVNWNFWDEMDGEGLFPLKSLFM